MNVQALQVEVLRLEKDLRDSQLREQQGRVREGELQRRVDKSLAVVDATAARMRGQVRF